MIRSFPVIFFLNLLAITSFSQSKNISQAKNSIGFELEKNRIVFSDTLHFQGEHNSDRLFNNAHAWFQDKYQSADNVIITDNPGEGKFSITGIIHKGGNKSDKESDGRDILFTADLFIADNYYAYKIYDLSYMENGIKIPYSDVYEEQLHPQSKPRWAESVRIMMLAQLKNSIGGTVNTLMMYMSR